MFVRISDESRTMICTVVFYAGVPHRILVLHRSGTIPHHEVVALGRDDDFGDCDPCGGGRGEPTDFRIVPSVERVAEEVTFRGVAHVHDDGWGDGGDVDHSCGSGEGEGEKSEKHGSSAGRWPFRQHEQTKKISTIINGKQEKWYRKSLTFAKKRNASGP